MGHITLMNIRIAISPIVIAVVLTAIVVAVASIYYAQLTSLSHLSASALEIVDAKLIKHYGYVRLILKVYNGNDNSVDIVTKLYTEFKETISKIDKIPPKTTKTIIIEGRYGHKFLVGKKYIVEVMGLRGGDSDITDVECKGIQLFNGQVLILAPTTMLHIIPNMHEYGHGGSITNVSEVVSGILEIVEELGVPTRVIDNLEDWKYIVEHPAEYKNAMVINPFGGIVPVPTEYLDSEEEIYEFIEKIGNNTRRYGWIWTHTTGYPFYYASDGSKGVPLYKRNGIGFRKFLGIEKKWSLVCHGISDEQHYMQTGTYGIPDLRTWIKELGYSNIADKITDTMRIRYSLKLRRIPQEWINTLIYLKEHGNQGERRSGALVLNLGKGLYVHWGSPYFIQFSDKELGELALLTALYAVQYR